MNAFLIAIKRAALLVAIMMVLLAGIYPLIVRGLGAGLFPHQSEGSLIKKGDVIIGSALIGQTFTSPRYFHSRPSAAGPGYDATASGGSNLGPTSKKWLEGVAANIKTYRDENHLPLGTLIPGDAVTASASGLDPHISPQNALLQTQRVAEARGLPIQKVDELVQASTDRAFLGFIGQDAVNVLTLNLALDRSTPH